MGCTEWTSSCEEGTDGELECSKGRSTIVGQCAVSDEGIDDRTVSAWWGGWSKYVRESGLADCGLVPVG